MVDNTSALMLLEQYLSQDLKPLINAGVSHPLISQIKETDAEMINTAIKGTHDDIELLKQEFPDTDFQLLYAAAVFWTLKDFLTKNKYPKGDLHAFIFKIEAQLKEKMTHSKSFKKFILELPNSPQKCNLKNLKAWAREIQPPSQPYLKK